MTPLDVFLYGIAFFGAAVFVALGLLFIGAALIEVRKRWPKEGRR